MIHQGVLTYRSRRYFIWATTLVVLCIALYISQDDAQPRNGGTWQGCVLGAIGALLVVWLTALGLRKRRYSSRTGSVQGWTSAHIYLGTALVVVATLHSGFQFGANVHTLAYALMCIVIVSGLVGLYIYLSVPSLVSMNREGRTRSNLFAELFELNNETLATARRCAVDVTMAVSSAIERSTIGGGVYTQLSSADRSMFLREGATGTVLVSNEDQQPVIDFVAFRIPRAEKESEAETLQQLIVLLSRRQVVLRRLRRDIRLQAWLRVWLYVHVPVTVALLVALVVHIVSTFLYR